MQFTRPTYHRPATVPERYYPAGVVVESTLRVWAISRWRGPAELTHAFLTAGYRYLPRGAPAMFHLDVNRDPTSTVLISILAHFTNPYDAYSLLGQVF
jgi:hypothetical protein